MPSSSSENIPQMSDFPESSHMDISSPEDMYQYPGLPSEVKGDLFQKQDGQSQSDNLVDGKSQSDNLVGKERSDSEPSKSPELRRSNRQRKSPDFLQL